MTINHGSTGSDDELTASDAFRSSASNTPEVTEVPGGATPEERTNNIDNICLENNSIIYKTSKSHAFHMWAKEDNALVELGVSSLETNSQLHTDLN